MLRPSPRSSDCVFDSENPLTADAADAGADQSKAPTSRLHDGASSLRFEEAGLKRQETGCFRILGAQDLGLRQDLELSTQIRAT